MTLNSSAQDNSLTDMSLDHSSVQRILQHLIDQAGNIILGKTKQIRLALSCLLAGGHLLIDDIPGVGKTTLSLMLAKLLGLEFNRIQFTSDLLPADILGASIFNKQTNQFEFQAGPVFSHMLLADEINRATPKAQSALLEAMEEKQVSIDGKTRQLPEPFFVVATQNPSQHIGTFPLPESQLDRFMLCIQLGYPSFEAEREILTGSDRKTLIQSLSCCLSKQQLLAIRQSIYQVHASNALIDYLQRIIDFTRTHSSYESGLSTRGSLALLHCAKAWAYLSNRLHVLPEDLQAVLPGILKHRLVATNEDHLNLDPAQEIITQVAVP